MRTMSDAMSRFVLGRPGPRFFEPSYLLATRRRYQRKMVSGVTIVGKRQTNPGGQLRAADQFAGVSRDFG